MLKPTSPASAHRPRHGRRAPLARPSTAPLAAPTLARRRRPSDRAAAVELAAHARPARARADDPGRRARRRRQAQRSRDRRAARRFARPRARGVPRARGIGARPAREEPRRLRAPDQRRGSRRDLRSCAPCSTNSSGRRARAERATPTTCASSRRSVERMERAAARGDVDGYHAANLAFHDRLVAARRQRRSCSPRIAGSSTSCTSTGAQRSARPASLPVSIARAPRDRRARSPRGRPPPPGARCTST